jgi:hypothetical protein
MSEGAMDGKQGIAHNLRKLTAPAMLQVSPGRWVPTTEDSPEYTVCVWRQVGGGQFELVPETTRLVRVDRRLLSALGLAHQGRTLRRLAQAGFIEMLLAAPSTWLLNLDSWFNHLRRVAEDEEFWEPGNGNLEEYHSVLRGAGRLN